MDEASNEPEDTMPTATTAAAQERVSQRVQALKERYLSTKPTVCTERARIYTEVYQRHEAHTLY